MGCPLTMSLESGWGVMLVHQPENAVRVNAKKRPKPRALSRLLYAKTPPALPPMALAEIVSLVRRVLRYQSTRRVRAPERGPKTSDAPARLPAKGRAGARSKEGEMLRI